MISDAVLTAVLYCHNFDPYKYKNPFAYFTQVVKYAFLNRIKNEKEEQYNKYKSFHDTMVLGIGGTFDTVSHVEDTYQVPQSMYDNMYTFMDDFEKKVVEERNKRKVKVKEKRGLEEFYEDEGSSNVAE